MDIANELNDAGDNEIITFSYKLMAAFCFFGNHDRCS